MSRCKCGIPEKKRNWQLDGCEDYREMRDELATLRAKLTEVEGERDEARRKVEELRENIQHEIDKDQCRIETEIDLTQTRTALAEMTERAKVLGEAVIKEHSRPTTIKHKSLCRTKGYPGGDCNCKPEIIYYSCGCPSCTIAREVLKE